jgi:hypothetical protein
MAAFRFSALLVAATLCLSATAQTPASTQPVPALEAALSGGWTGVLEYRDYSEPPTSTKRVQLPTWLTVDKAADGLHFHYIYDDGPTKTVEERDTVVIDGAKQTYAETEDGKPAMIFAVAGLSALKDGRGELTLTRLGEDNDKPAEMRSTIAVRRNLLTVLEEVRPAGSTEPFAFRHRFVFTRSTPPAVPSTR